MTEDVILKVITRFLVPFIKLYSLYVIAFGESGPGGGFQGGVIYAAAVILEKIVYEKKLQKPDIFASLGVMIYAGTGFLCLILGGYFLEYNVLHNNPATGNATGIFVIEVGVAITVSATMITIFNELTAD